MFKKTITQTIPNSMLFNYINITNKKFLYLSYYYYDTNCKAKIVSITSS